VPPYPTAPPYWLNAWLALAGLLALALPLLTMLCAIVCRFKLLDFRLLWKPLLLGLYLPLVLALLWAFRFAQVHDIAAAGGIPELIGLLLLILLTAGLSFAAGMSIARACRAGTEMAILFVLLFCVLVTGATTYAIGRAYMWNREALQAWVSKTGTQILSAEVDDYLSALDLPYVPMGRNIARKIAPGPPPDPEVLGYRAEILDDYMIMYHYKGVEGQERDHLIRKLRAAGYTVYHLGQHPLKPGRFLAGYREGVCAIYQLSADIASVHVYTTYHEYALEHFVKGEGFERISTDEDAGS